jgi:hypothetical protein
MSYQGNRKDFMSRQQRDALRIHAQQIIRYFVAKSSRTYSDSVRNFQIRKKAAKLYLWNELRKAADELAGDYYNNRKRAWDKCEFERWMRIAAVAESADTESEKLDQLTQALVRRAELAQLAGGTANTVYALLIASTKILDELPALASSMSCSASTAPALMDFLSALGQAQPYLTIGIQVFLLIFEIVCLFNHQKKDKVKDKGETVAAKLQQHGRWQRYANAALWLSTGVALVIIKATIVGVAAAVPALAVVGATIFISGLLQFVRQAVELQKLVRKRHAYTSRIKELRHELAPYDPQSEIDPPAEGMRLSRQVVEQKQAELDGLMMLRQDLDGKINDGRPQLLNGTCLPLLSLCGIALTLIGMTSGVMPIMLLGSLILFGVAVATLVLNGKRGLQMAKGIRQWARNQPRLSPHSITARPSTAGQPPPRAVMAS